MSVRNLLTEEVQLFRQSAGAVDEYNTPTDEFAAAEFVRGRLEQRSSQELTEDRQTVVSDWVLFLMPDVVVDPQDRVVDAFGRTFEIVGAPAMRATPLRNMLVEVSLRHIDSV